MYGFLPDAGNWWCLWLGVEAFEPNFKEYFVAALESYEQIPKIY
jgi:hypothetical protein